MGFIDGLFGIAATGLNNAMGKEREEQARKSNYTYNELSASNADKRQRALYEDYYSPSAQLGQIRAAGLSPSLFFGSGGGGMGSTPSGAQGSGVNGISPNTQFIDPMMAAQLNLMEAQVNKTNAETDNISTDTKIKDLVRRTETLNLDKYQNYYEVTKTFLILEDGQEIDLYDYAKGFKDFQEFKKGVDKFYNGRLNTYQMEALGDIWKYSKQLDTEISILNADKTNADFQTKILNAMERTDFVNLNAKAAITQLRAITEESELTKQQKEAWNNLLNKMENGTTRDLIIVLGMILNNAASNWRPMPNVSISRSTSKQE